MKLDLKGAFNNVINQIKSKKGQEHAEFVLIECVYNNIQKAPINGSVDEKAEFLQELWDFFCMKEPASIKPTDEATKGE